MNKTDYINAITSPTINYELATAAAYGKIIDAITAIVIANTAVMKTISSTHVARYLKLAEEFTDSHEILKIRINNEDGGKDEVELYEFSSDPTKDIMTAVKLLSELSNAYIETEFSYKYYGDDYTGFTYECDFHKYAVVYKIEF